MGMTGMTGITTITPTARLSRPSLLKTITLLWYTEAHSPQNQRTRAHRAPPVSGALFVVTPMKILAQRLSIAQWLEYVASYDFGPLTPSRLVLHHTYRPDEKMWAGITSIRGMQRFYENKGWTAGPHLYAAPDGIWLFTPMSEVGIHAGTGNGGVRAGWYSIGLEMVGFFDRARPTGVVWEESLAVMGSLSQRLGIVPRQLISFHRDYTGEKSCPGWAVTKDWVWREVEGWLTAHQTPAPPPPLRWFEIVAGPANVRQGPSTAFPRAAQLQVGETFGVDAVVTGERYRGVSEWAHLADQRGFVWSGLLAESTGATLGTARTVTVRRMPPGDGEGLG